MNLSQNVQKNTSSNTSLPTKTTHNHRTHSPERLLKALRHTTRPKSSRRMLHKAPTAIRGLINLQIN